MMGDTIKIFQDKLINGQINNLEKIMKILKSKHRDMHIKKVFFRLIKISDEGDDRINLQDLGKLTQLNLIPK